MKPYTPEEIDAAAGLFKADSYDFEVMGAVDKVSKSGNEMIEMRVSVYSQDGEVKTIKDWLVDGIASAFKVRNFAHSIEMIPEYEAGELTADSILGRTGRCKVGVKKDGDFPEKNVILDYLKPTMKSALAAAAKPVGGTAPKARVSVKPAVRAPAQAVDIDLSDEIPF